MHKTHKELSIILLERDRFLSSYNYLRKFANNWQKISEEFFYRWNPRKHKVEQLFCILIISLRYSIKPRGIAMRLLSRYLLNPNDRRVFRSFYLWIVLVFLTSRERERVNPIILEQTTPLSADTLKKHSKLYFDVDFWLAFICRFRRAVCVSSSFI